jgi:hypothetical protein
MRSEDGHFRRGLVGPSTISGALLVLGALAFASAAHGSSPGGVVEGVRFGERLLNVFERWRMGRCSLFPDGGARLADGRARRLLQA